MTRARLTCALLFGALLLSAHGARAEVVTSGFSFNGRYTSLGESGGPQDLILFGMNATPNGSQGTTATYSQTDTLSGGIVTGPMRYPNFSLAPDLFDALVPYSPGLAGAWQITFSNAGDDSVAHTPELGPAPALPFVESISVQGGGSTPTVRWKVPASPDVKRQQVWVWETRPDGSGDLIYTSPSLSPAVGVYEIPPVLSNGGSLEVGKGYSFSFVLFYDRDEGGITRYEVSRSFTYIPYTVLANAPDPIFLPVVEQVGGQPVFSFQPIDVAPGQEILIDPLLAIGYVYEVRDGDPLFQSVRLPGDLGDDSFQVEYLEGGTTVVIELAAGDTFAFPVGGVDRFTVRGIDVALDAADSTAFITALTFTGAGVFAGKMTPIVAVPEPSTVVFSALGLLLLVGVIRRANPASRL